MPKISGVDTGNFSKINGISKTNISKVNGISGLFAASPTPTPTNTPTRTVTPTRTPTPSVTPTITPSISVSPTRTPTVTPSVTPSITVSPTRTPTVTPSVTPSISVSPTRTPTVTPTVTPSITASPTRTPTVTPTPSSSPAACNNINVSSGPTKDVACYPNVVSFVDINGTDLSNSTIIYDSGFSCNVAKKAGAGYYKDSTGLYYWNGTNTLSPDTCPPCDFVSVNYNATSDRMACYAGNNIVNVYIDSATPTLNDPITHLWNSCVWNDLAPNGYYYSQGDNVLVYWDGSTVTKPSCPPCYDLSLTTYPSAAAACIGGGIAFGGPYADDPSLSAASGLYTDCSFQTAAATGYYTQDPPVPGANIYYWDGTTLSFDSTCP